MHEGSRAHPANMFSEVKLMLAEDDRNRLPRQGTTGSNPPLVLFVGSPGPEDGPALGALAATGLLVVLAPGPESARRLLEVWQSDQFTGATLKASFGDITVSERTHEATFRGAVLALTFQERRILSALIRQAPAVVPRADLHREVWGNDYLGDSSHIDSAMQRLRAKLWTAGVPVLIQAVRGVGHRIRGIA